MSGDLGDGIVTMEGIDAFELEPSLTDRSGRGFEPAVAGMPRQVRRGDDGGGALAAAADPVAEASAVVGSAIGAAVDKLSGARPFSMWLRDWGLHLEAMTAFTAGVVAALVLDQAPYLALLALGIWMLGNYHRGRAVTTPLTRQLKSVVTSALLPLAMLGGAVGFFAVPSSTVPQAFAAVSAGAVTSVIIRSLRWRLQAPVRVVVAGDRAAIATAVARWVQTPNVQVVGGLVVETDLPADSVPLEILGVPTVMGLDEARTRLVAWQADLLVVDPGSGVSAEVFRRLTWALEDSGVAVGVTGVLESVAPHRVMPGGLGRCGIMDVRSPQPSRFVQGLKAAGDRVGALVLLILAAPVLLAMVAAVKLDTRGPAFFAQTRVGRRGRHFKVYKMRTMVQHADAIKHELHAHNEFDSVLFKIREDPRITRVGRVLRKTSLDELPQLFNVLLGSMSLVGPRPHLPSEIELMDGDTKRRLAVKPGITGLWQVSGRSDLPWDQAVELDTYYADNWNLTTDARICVGTVRAVVSGRGAY
jgi:exopolysaccharide biosynthesis polyprenyl glycosylphosphotransferase